MSLRPNVLVASLLVVAFAASGGACDAPKASPPGPVSSVHVTEAPAAPVASASAVPTAAAVPDAIAAQHVLVAHKGATGAPRSVTRTKADAKKRAEEVVSKAKSGADFSALVAEYSDDEGTKSRMGRVGKFTREKMTKRFSDAAFALAVDETSGVVETEFGYHVIRRNQ
jgi:hypothetical protein